jgi:hypothetical protein
MARLAPTGANMTAANNRYKNPAWWARRTKPRWLRILSGGLQWHLVAAVFMAFFPVPWAVMLGLALTLIAALFRQRTRVEGIGFIVLGPASTIALNLLVGLPTGEWPVWLPYWPWAI